MKSVKLHQLDISCMYKKRTESDTLHILTEETPPHIKSLMNNAWQYGVPLVRPREKKTAQMRSRLLTEKCKK